MDEGDQATAGIRVEIKIERVIAAAACDRQQVVDSLKPMDSPPASGGMRMSYCNVPPFTASRKSRYPSGSARPIAVSNRRISSGPTGVKGPNSTRPR